MEARADDICPSSLAVGQAKAVSSLFSLSSENVCVPVLHGRESLISVLVFAGEHSL